MQWLARKKLLLQPTLGMSLFQCQCKARILYPLQSHTGFRAGAIVSALHQQCVLAGMRRMSGRYLKLGTAAQASEQLLLKIRRGSAIEVVELHL